MVLFLLFLGGISGFVIAKITTSSSTDSSLEAKNQQLEAELSQYKQDVEQHFAASADLLGNMAQEYSKVYQHMAQAQQSLLPDSELTIKIPFNDAKETSVVQDAIEEVELEVQAKTESSQVNNESEQPNDYVDGSHGIINADEATAKPETEVKQSA
ncbi:YhcB family protein [Psychrobium sp. 1_MG-2023]|uniref:YhcB family protein n=1 Tax=Psychrobium sp. 1_MG-2023 TaxID=3062624 RepID=UPI0026CA9334|nr:DUF1043 family protein [Psychrobium sp. 1_MG-2023]MDP2560689.1 DUF1043 family protein [Psychrobium sp. 1_MG-2023]